MKTKVSILTLAALGLAGPAVAAMSDEEAKAAMAQFDAVLANVGSDIDRINDEADGLIKVAQADTGTGGVDQAPTDAADQDAGQPDTGAASAAGGTEDQEPNNKFGEAQSGSAQGVLSGTIHPKGDADWIAFDVDHQGELKFTATMAPKTQDISYRIWNADKYALSSWYTPLRVGGPADGVFDVPEPGRYVIEMRDGKNDTGSTEKYGFELEFTPTADTGEPNDKFGQPTPIEFDAPFQSNILPKGDADWYAIEVEDQGELTVNITDAPDNLDISFRIWDADKYAISSWFAPLAQGGPVEGVFDLPQAGRYMIEVRDGKDDARSAIPFTTEVSFKPSGDQSEPNNKFGKASVLELGEELQATILPKGDADWYRIEAPAGELQIIVSNVAENLDISVRVWDSDKYAVSSWMAPFRAGGDTEGSFGLEKAGTYFLEVRDGKNDNRSVEPYTLTATIKGN